MWWIILLAYVAPKKVIMALIITLPMWGCPCICHVRIANMQEQVFWTVLAVVAACACVKVEPSREQY